MTTDGLEPPGEQLELFPDPGFVETVVHKTRLHRFTADTYRWTCACGHNGPKTSHGHAVAGMHRHMTAVRRRSQLRTDRP